MPDELRQQVPILKEILELLGCHVVEKEGYEADDILGTLSAAACRQNAECFIATGDRDSLQLVNNCVTVLLAATRFGRAETVVCNTEAIREKYGLTPAQLIDLKALMGDASDNIPGVPGVGEKPRSCFCRNTAVLTISIKTSTALILKTACAKSSGPARTAPT